MHNESDDDNHHRINHNGSTVCSQPAMSPMNIKQFGTNKMWFTKVCQQKRLSKNSQPLFLNIHFWTYLSSRKVGNCVGPMGCLGQKPGDPKGTTRLLLLCGSSYGPFGLDTKFPATPDTAHKHNRPPCTAKNENVQPTSHQNLPQDSS